MGQWDPREACTRGRYTSSFGCHRQLDNTWVGPYSPCQTRTRFYSVHECLHPGKSRILHPVVLKDNLRYDIFQNIRLNFLRMHLCNRCYSAYLVKNVAYHILCLSPTSVPLFSTWWTFLRLKMLQKVSYWLISINSLLKGHGTLLVIFFYFCCLICFRNTFLIIN